jgi:hypothetical protein
MRGLDQNLPHGDWFWGVEWIHLAQDKDRWWAVVSVVMNLRVLETWSKFHVCIITGHSRIRQRIYPQMEWGNI